MIKSKRALAEKIVSDMLDLDLINSVDYDETNAKLDIIDIIMRNLQNCMIINGEPVPEYTDEELIV